MTDSIIKIPGYKIPGYKIDHEIGRGGMATVYLAWQESLNRKVALKVMSPALSADEDFKTRFLNEGHIVGQLNHSNIVTIFDIGTHENHYYLSMEYLPNGSLRDRIRRKLPVKETLQIARTLGKALGYAHHRGFVHRDIKPLNVLFRDDDSPVLTDFGIAKALGSSSQLTRTGYAFGSVGYMSPEQALGKQIDHRTDIYSFGAMLWEMLTGTKLYESGDAFSLALKHATAPIPRLPDELARFQPMIERLLAKQVDDRFESMEAFVKELDIYIQGSGPVPVIGNGAQSRPDDSDATVLQEPATSRSPATTPPPPARSSTASTRAIAAAVLVLAVTGGGTLWLMPELNPFRSPEPPLVDETPVPEPDPVAIAPDDPPPLTEPEEPVSATTPSIDELLARGEQQWQAGRYTEPPGDNAFETYRQVIEQDPDNARAQDRLVGIGRIRLGQQHEQSARELLAAGNLDQSLEQVEQGLRLAPDYAPLRVLREEIEQHIIEGETIAVMPAEKPTADIDTLLARAREHREAGRYTAPPGDNAFEIYQRVLELEPENPVARQGLTDIGRIRMANRFRSEAAALIDSGDIQAGLTEIERGLQLFPEDTGLLELRQEAQARLNDQ